MKQLEPLRSRWVVAALAIPLFVVPFLSGQADVQFFPLSEVRPGLRGVGRTVFEGEKIEEFQVEVLGVLKNVIGPKHDVILARLSGGPLERTGVIQGMSGSPVYIDGKLLGAVALSFPFSKEPVAGITPIEEMLEVVPGPGPPAPAAPATRMNYHLARVATDPPEGGRLIPEGDDAASILSKLLPSQAGESTVSGLRLPLRFGGFSSQAIQTYTPLFRQMGFEPLEGGALSAGESTPPSTAELEPGSMISLLLVRGDLNLNGDCTVTYRRGNNLYACGHRIFLMGPAQIPFAQSRVLGTVPSLAMSFKLDAPGPPVGTIRQDRFGAIYGEVGDMAPLIPVHIRVDSTLNRKADYNFEMVQETFLSPLLLNLGVVSTLTATERMLGPSTVEIKGNIHLSGGQVIDLEDVVSSDINTPGAAGAAVSLPLAYLLASGFLDMRVEGIDLSIVSRNEKRVATLDQVWSTKSEVHPGDHIEVTALLRTPSGETAIQKIPVTIPESVRDKTLSVVVGSGPTLNAFQSGFNPLTAVPRDLPHLVRNLNRMRRNDRLYALLMAPQRSFILQGDEYPSPPPSLVQTFLADPAASSSVIFSGSSVIGDFETKSSPYSIRGQKTLLLKVVGAGS
jgi:hypothetical protein